MSDRNIHACHSLEFYTLVLHSYFIPTLLAAKIKDNQITTVHLLLDKSRIILINYSGHHDLNLPVEHKRKSNHVVGTKHPVFSSGREETPYPRLEGREGET